MNTLTTRYTIKTAATICLISVASFSQMAFASTHESECKESIQGKISWDPGSVSENATKWEDANLDSLCKGTKKPKEPGQCFQKLMAGDAKWGASDKWEWKNAISLCAGTDNADQSIACFKGRIDAGEKWDAAIFQCQSHKNNVNKVE